MLHGEDGGQRQVCIRDRLATNAQLIERAVTIVESLGATVIGPDAVRAKLGLTKRAPA